MEKIRRALKIFWIEHGTPILFWIIVLIVVIFIVQGLNSLAIKQQQYEKKENSTNSTKINDISTKEKEQNIELINSFLNYCKNKQIKQAYDLLSENCKNDLYPTLNDFSEKYYNKLFNKNSDIEVEYENNSGFYKIIFYEDMLESGKVDGRDNIIDYYKIEEEILENKVYINIKNSIK